MPVWRSFALLVDRAAACETNAEHADDSPAFRLRGVFLRHHDVQSSAAGRDHRTCRGHGSGKYCARTVGVHCGDLGGLVRSRRSSSATEASPRSARIVSTWPSSDRWSAYSVYRLLSRRRCDRFQPPGCCGGNRGICGHQRGGPLRGHRVRDSAGIVPRCFRRAALCALRSQRFHPRDAHRSPHFCRARRTGDFSRHRCGGCKGWILGLLRLTAPDAPDLDQSGLAARGSRALAHGVEALARPGRSDDLDSSRHSGRGKCLGRVERARFFGSASAASDGRRIRKSAPAHTSPSRLGATLFAVDGPTLRLCPKLYSQRLFRISCIRDNGSGIHRSPRFALMVAMRNYRTDAVREQVQCGPDGGAAPSFVEKTIRSLLDVVQHSLFAEETANSPGLLQRLDARVKLVGIGLLIFAAVALHRISVLAAIADRGSRAGAASRISIRVLATKVWIAVLAFTGAIALPAIFLTPGVAVFRLPVLDWAGSIKGCAAPRS